MKLFIFATLCSIFAMAQTLAPSPPATNILSKQMTCSHSTVSKMTTCTVRLTFANSSAAQTFNDLPLIVTQDGCTHGKGACSRFVLQPPLCLGDPYVCTYGVTIPESAYTLNRARKVSNFVISLLRTEIFDEYGVVMFPPEVIVQADTGLISSAFTPSILAGICMSILFLLL